MSRSRPWPTYLGWSVWFSFTPGSVPSWTRISRAVLLCSMMTHAQCASSSDSGSHLGHCCSHRWLARNTDGWRRI
ncbi:hypothetical protein HD554DRAFT_2072239, partial [Boletus coccyginus]